MHKNIKGVVCFSLLLMLFSFSCNKAGISIRKIDTKEVILEIMTNAKNGALITVDSLGVAHARVMDPFLPENDFTVWMATNPNSLKVKQIQKNNKVTLFYFDKKNTGYVSLQGIATLVNNKEEKKKRFKDAWKSFYKNRTTDYLLIKFTPKKATVVSEKYNLLGDSITWKTPELLFLYQTEK